MPVFEDVVSGFGQSMGFGLRKAPAPFGQEIEIEAVGPDNFPFTYCVFCRK